MLKCNLCKLKSNKNCRKLIFLLLFTPTMLMKLFIYLKYEEIQSLHVHKRARIFHTTEQNVEAECELTISGNISELKGTKMYKDLTTDEEIEVITERGCDHIFQHYSFVVDSNQVSNEETSYPIAYSILSHHNAHQLMLLLSQIYSPQNVYCIHLDRKSPQTMLRALKHVQSCFPNVRLASKREVVVYASFSRLQADLNCMQDLLRSSVAWRHLINLSGQDFPTKTNLEIVKALKTLKGKNSISGDKNPSESNLARTRFVHRIDNTTNEDGTIVRKIVQSAYPKNPPPFNITLRKNLAYNIFSRQFLHWVLVESEKAKALLEWSRDTLTPDEHYWLMLDALEEAPGRTGKISWRMMTPYTVWKSKTNHCSGYWNHYSCIFGRGDLSALRSQKKLFANKFDITYDALPLQCLKQWLKERKLLEFKHG